MVLVGILALVVVADVPFQLWQYFDRLKMTRDEVRQEMKEMLGDPRSRAASAAFRCRPPASA